jgi:hypothetical protein
VSARRVSVCLVSDQGVGGPRDSKRLDVADGFDAGPVAGLVVGAGFSPKFTTELRTAQTEQRSGEDGRYPGIVSDAE